jgi:hypothetical protein
MNRCRICGKRITDPAAKFGDDCQRRFDEALAGIETTPTEVGELFLMGDSTVQRFLTKMTSALISAIKSTGPTAAGHRKWAKEFLNYARRNADCAAIERRDERQRSPRSFTVVGS